MPHGLEDDALERIWALDAQAVRVACNIEPEDSRVLGTTEADPAIGQPHDERGGSQVGMIAQGHDPTGQADPLP